MLWLKKREDRRHFRERGGQELPPLLRDCNRATSFRLPRLTRVQNRYGGQGGAGLVEGRFREPSYCKYCNSLWQVPTAGCKDTWADLRRGSYIVGIAPQYSRKRTTQRTSFLYCGKTTHYHRCGPSSTASLPALLLGGKLVSVVRRACLVPFAGSTISAQHQGR